MADPIPPPNAPSEPLAPVAGIVAAVSAVLDLVVAFGLHLTADQRAAVITVITAVAPLAVWVWGRRKVFSPAMVRRMMMRGPQT